MKLRRGLKFVLLLAACSLLFSGQALAAPKAARAAGAASAGRKSVAAATGTLKICKIAGDAATAGVSFTFTFAGQTLTVPAGSGLSSCKISGPLNVGHLTVTAQV